MSETFQHREDGKVWEREKVKEDVIEGFLDGAGDKVTVERNKELPDVTPPDADEVSVTHKLKRVSGKEVRITIEAWEWREQEKDDGEEEGSRYEKELESLDPYDPSEDELPPDALS